MPLTDFNIWWASANLSAHMLHSNTTRTSQTSSAFFLMQSFVPFYLSSSLIFQWKHWDFLAWLHLNSQTQNPIIQFLELSGSFEVILSYLKSSWVILIHLNPLSIILSHTQSLSEVPSYLSCRALLELMKLKSIFETSVDENTISKPFYNFFQKKLIAQLKRFSNFDQRSPGSKKSDCSAVFPSTVCSPAFFFFFHSVDFLLTARWRQSRARALCNISDFSTWSCANIDFYHHGFLSKYFQNYPGILLLFLIS